MKQELMELATDDLKVIWRESKQAREYKGPQGAIVLRPRDQEQLIEVLLRRCTKLENENEKLHDLVSNETPQKAIYFDQDKRSSKNCGIPLQMKEVPHNDRKKNFSIY